MIEKTILIDNKSIRFRASATIPRLYRHLFRRDIFKDIQMLAEDVDAGDKNASQIPIDNLEVFENVAYCMAKHADPTLSNSIEEWLDQFGTFSIYTILPELVELWTGNLATEAEAKKKFQKLQEG